MRKRNRENGATERLIRRAQPTEEQWFMSHMVERWVILALLQNPQPPTHTDNPLSYSLTQAQPLGRVIVKFSLTDSIMPPDSIKYKEKHLTMCVTSNRAQSGNFAHWQMPEKSMCTYQREKQTTHKQNDKHDFLALKACPENRGMKMHFVLLIKYRICPTFSMTQIPTPLIQHPRKKNAQHNGKTHGKPICSAFTKNNLCQVHQLVGLERSSHFIMEVGSSRVGLPVNAFSRSAFTGSHPNKKPHII